MNPPKRRVEIRDRYLVLPIGLKVGDAVLAGVGAVGAVTKVEVRPLVLLNACFMFIDQFGES